MPALLAGLAAAAERGFALPLVWNCGGYESLEALQLLDGVVDLYLPDAKYGRDAEGESNLRLRQLHRGAAREPDRDVAPDRPARAR